MAPEKKVEHVDNIFYEGFVSTYIFYLAHHQHAQTRINNAQTSIGNLGRIFDEFTTACQSQDQIEAAIKEAGGIAAFTHAMMQEFAAELLNEDKNALSLKVIKKGIGINRYMQTVGTDLCQIQNDIVIATPGKEEKFAQRQEEIARQFMGAVVMSYTATVREKNILPNLEQSPGLEQKYNINVMGPMGTIIQRFHLSQLGGELPRYDVNEIESKVNVLVSLLINIESPNHEMKPILQKFSDDLARIPDFKTINTELITMNNPDAKLDPEATAIKMDDAYKIACANFVTSIVDKNIALNDIIPEPQKPGWIKLLILVFTSGFQGVKQEYTAYAVAKDLDGMVKAVSPTSESGASTSIDHKATLQQMKREGNDNPLDNNAAPDDIQPGGP